MSLVGVKTLFFSLLKILSIDFSSIAEYVLYNTIIVKGRTTLE
jgi:hypothetical protein